MVLTAFSTPGRVDELSDRGHDRWSQDLGGLLDAEAAGNTKVPNDSPRPQFFNPLAVELNADATRKVMRWGAFPRKLTRVPIPERWRQGEERGRQEEYCEWAGERDDEGKLTRASFTSEVPSYYHLLAADNPEKLRAVYRQHVSPDAELKDLISATGAYRERNRWNLHGAMHMIQTSNTLSAAVILVAQSTIVRQRDNALLTNASDLIDCGVNADPDRNSDPLIVGDVNTLARAHAAISLDDPLGLYIDNLQTDGWATPDGSDPADYWQITRGETDHAVRAVYAVPADKGFTISDITIHGTPITSPSQIAEFIQIKVVGVAHEIGQHTEPPRGCADETDGGLESLTSPDTELPSIDELIAASRRSR
jgi:hypothetical protein